MKNMDTLIQQGKLVIPCIYKKAYNFHDGLALASINGKSGYINTTGEIVYTLELGLFIWF